MIQITIIYYVSINSLTGFYLGDRELHDEPILNISRFAVCIILHINIIPELENAIALMKFAKDIDSDDIFKGGGRMYPFLCGLMKFTGGMLTEVLNSIVIL